MLSAFKVGHYIAEEFKDISSVKGENIVYHRAETR